MTHRERHRIRHSGWLRAAVLGANDGIVSTAGLIMGIAAANADSRDLLISGTAGLIAGAMSMAAGEYVAVSSQADNEKADLGLERKELLEDGAKELQELAAIYRARGLDAELAHRVAEQLMAHDALDAHARDELGITEITRPQPIRAALSSALAFAAGALLPLTAAVIGPMPGFGRLLGMPALMSTVALVALLALLLLGASAALIAGSPVRLGAVRALVWGALSMAVTSGIGSVFRLTDF